MSFREKHMILISLTMIFWSIAKYNYNLFSWTNSYWFTYIAVYIRGIIRPGYVPYLIKYNNWGNHSFLKLLERLCSRRKRRCCRGRYLRWMRKRWIRWWCLVSQTGRYLMVRKTRWGRTGGWCNDCYFIFIFIFFNRLSTLLFFVLLEFEWKGQPGDLSHFGFLFWY